MNFIGKLAFSQSYFDELWSNLPNIVYANLFNGALLANQETPGVSYLLVMALSSKLNCLPIDSNLFPLKINSKNDLAYSRPVKSRPSDAKEASNFDATEIRLD